jgi:hypothetical protein
MNPRVVATGACLAAVAGTSVLSAPAPAAPPAQQVIGPAYTFEEAIGQCERAYVDDRLELSDCINAAIVSWCMFEPLPPDNPHYKEDVDGRCAAGR